VAVNADDVYAAVTWGAPTVVPMTGIGYKVYLLTPGQEDDPTTWITLTGTPVPVMYFNDYVWANLATGTYKWAVRTCYAGNVISEPAFSNELQKIVTIPQYTIRVTTNSNETPVGAVVTLTGPQTYTAELTGTMVTFSDVQTGDYTLTVTLTGFNNFTDSFEITTPETRNVVLIETINDPYDLDVNGALFTWNHEALKPFLGFTVYLDGVLKAKNIMDKEYLFIDIEPGTYIAGVQANYASGNSEIINTEFTYVGIIDLENGFSIFPNPAMDKITVKRTNSDHATIDLYNAMGMHIATYEIDDVQFNITVSSFAAGTYFLRVTEGENSTVKSFVKK
jgi:hypothetical protein